MASSLIAACGLGLGLDPETVEAILTRPPFMEAYLLASAEIHKSNPDYPPYMKISTEPLSDSVINLDSAHRWTFGHLERHRLFTTIGIITAYRDF